MTVHRCAFPVPASPQARPQPKGHRMTDAGRLELNARSYRYDPLLDPIADAMDRGDTAAWQSLHPTVQDRASIYADFRRQHRRAVAAGVIPDSKGPTAA